MESQQSTVYWKPDEVITLKGTELAALLQVVDLQTVAISQVPLNTLMEMFALATQAKNSIMERLADEGKLSATPTTEEVEEVMEEMLEPTQQPTQELPIPEDLSEISDEIL
jgi:polyhydroxyalkanoate synthesis regulator phasin